jgi:DNA polymerase
MSDQAMAEHGLKEALKAERQLQAGGNLRRSWEELLAEARRCTRCELYKHATQAVFGEGPLDAKILFVGEQPGVQEDLAGRPFVGPAGQLFDEALAKAGIDRSQTYVTNAVKHFKFIQRGKKRLHNKPNAGEITACRWWQEQERTLIKPPVTVALGATAARSLFGRIVTITSLRGKPQALPDDSECWVTVHPSFLLRMPDPVRRRAERAQFIEDLKLVRRRVEQLSD